MAGPSLAAPPPALPDPLQAPRHLGALLCMSIATAVTKISVKSIKASRFNALLPPKLGRRLSGAAVDAKELKDNANAAVVTAYKAAADVGSVPGAILVQGYVFGSKRRPSTAALQELLAEASGGHAWAAVPDRHVAHPDAAILYNTDVYEAQEIPEGGADAAAPRHGHGRRWVAARLGVKGSADLRFTAVSYHGHGHGQHPRGQRGAGKQAASQRMAGLGGARVSDVSIASVGSVKIAADTPPAELDRSPSCKRGAKASMGRASAAAALHEQDELLRLAAAILSDFSTPAIVAGDWGCEPAAALAGVATAAAMCLAAPEEPLPPTSCRLGKPATDAAVVINHTAAAAVPQGALGCKAAAIATTALPHPPRIQMMGFEHDALLLRFSLTQVAA